ncbi:Peptidoglycan-binding lysin domain protein [Solidesulfovibrio carbinoliphilus subsp. oakridgensis]|uniref:Peptidoglycan-binding lysin domain protein n=1 Tax=Solidesulfovibrio carbinoliphilus subsp. oakridgensis TaxID=694327 RepID=G7Q5T9_9BACT|nr:LysM peptidoglycan-binding domain-containing protein [Solidesulfovibrio carbinoliphilus]EHJ46876.1 Peptidoglycan-binding lysin domain protein [Solidesulfovibrio carbinoliphilus subsp. oakridgensis]
MRPIIACLALGLLAGVTACSGGDKDSFRNVDHDKNGRISYEELLFVFPEVSPEVFAKLDANGDGGLSLEEYQTFAKGDIQPAAGGQAPAKTPAAPKLPAQGQMRPGDGGQLSIPYRGEEVIEIPAPGSDAGAKSRSDKGKKDPKDQKAKPEATKSGEATQYTVVRGDNLRRIAHKFGVTVEDITRANGNMNPDTLRDGQVLTIPAHP